MLLPSRNIPSLLIVASLTLLTAGCSSLAHFSDPSTATSPVPAITGTVHGGQQPVSGATIQLYAANTTTSKGLSTALLTHPPTSDSHGIFTITDTNYCPAPGSLVYLVATGGNPGLTPPAGGTINNTALALMALLGTCSTLSSATVINVNELTTVAAVEALAPFMADSIHVGADATNPNGLAAAFAGAAAIVNFTTGTFVTPPTGVILPTALYNTLANILAACVNTSGSTANGAACGTLFTNAVNGTTTDTILAMLHIAQLPAQNVANLYGIVNASGPFQTAIQTVPIGFVGGLSVAVNGPQNGPNQILADSQFHIWLLLPTVGTLTQYDSNLNVLHTYSASSFASGGTPLYMTLDPSDNLWISLGTALVKISSNGTVVSPNTGYPLTQNGLITYARAYHPFTSDSFGNIWVIVSRISDGAICLMEYSGSGTLISPSTGYCGSQVVNTMSASPQPLVTQVLADSSGNVYLIYSDPIPVPMEKFGPSGSYTDLPTLSHYGGVYGYQTSVFDKKNQQIWGNGWTYLDKVNLDGSVAFTSYYAGQSAGPTEAFYLTPQNSIAVDGAGNYWGTSVFGGLINVTASGVLQATCIAYGCGILLVPDTEGEIEDVAIDPAGDIFVTAGFSLPAPSQFSLPPPSQWALIKITGLASAN